ncbi:MAG: isoprenyl transferase [Fidelibacterota bacterium]
MSLSDLRQTILNNGAIPAHVAIIMDGNGRWAKKKRLPRLAGHHEGINSVREITRVSGEIGIQYLTLYTFSSENWERPSREVSALMGLLVKTIQKEVKNLYKNNVRLSAIGDLKKLPPEARKGLEKGIAYTSENTGLNLVLALSYGSRQELCRAARRIAVRVTAGELTVDDINENVIIQELYTADIPDPDLLIRTGGEKRISNFLLWQSAYTEWYLTDTFWPEFREPEFLAAIRDFQCRERRFGKLSEQLSR